MKFVCLIYSDETTPGNRPMPGADEFTSMMAEYRAFGEEAGDRALAGESPERVATATSVRVGNGETFATDGPFAETKEQLGGFYILDCASREEALELAAKIPHARLGTIEVRAVPDRHSAPDNS